MNYGELTGSRNRRVFSLRLLPAQWLSFICLLRDEAVSIAANHPIIQADRQSHSVAGA